MHEAKQRRTRRHTLQLRMHHSHARQKTHRGQGTHPPSTQKKTPCWKELSAEHKHHRHVGLLTPNIETLELQKKCNFKENETTDSICLCARGQRHYWCDILTMRCEHRRALQMILKKAQATQQDGFAKMRAFEETLTAPVSINNCTGRHEKTGRRLLQKEYQTKPIQKQGRMKYQSIAEKLRPMWKHPQKYFELEDPTPSLSPSGLHSKRSRS